jgi:hypothetical protein
LELKFGILPAAKAPSLNSLLATAFLFAPDLRVNSKLLLLQTVLALLPEQITG